MAEELDRNSVAKTRKQPQKKRTELRPPHRRQYSAEEKVRIVVAGLRGEEPIVALCRNEGINQNLYYRWSNEFLEAGKNRLAGQIRRETPNRELKELRAEAMQLKQLLGELLLKNRLLKTKVRGRSEDGG